MKDQELDQLEAMGIQAAFLNSSLTQKEQQRIEKALSNGEIQFLYVAPEQFQTDIF